MLPIADNIVLLSDLLLLDPYLNYK